MKKILNNYNFWLTLTFIISFAFLLLSYMPNFYEASVVDLMPNDRTMLWGEHIYTYDYNVYLSKIRQGIEGRWTIVDKYDNYTNQSGVMLQMLYLLSGKIGGIFNLTPVLTFHLLRTILSVLWILTIIYFCLYFLKKPVLVFLGVSLSILAASWPIFYQFQNSTWVGYHMSWWTEMDVLKRISYLPHYLLNYINVALLFILISKYPNHISLRLGTNLKLKITYFQLICVIIFFSFFIHPAGGILFIFAWFIFNFISLIWLKSFSKTQFYVFIKDSIFLLISASLPLIYLQHVSSYYPWKSLTDFDQYNRIGVDIKEYILALGPVFFTGVIGMILVIVKKEKKLLSLATWVIAAFLAIYLFKFFPFQSELRFVQTANHIPLAVLSIYFFYELNKNLRKPLIKIVTALTILFMITLGLTQSYFSLKAQEDFIHQRAVATLPLVPYPPQVMYPLKDFWNALLWLKQNTKRDSVVLSQYTAGNYIPAYSGNFVYFGHNPETPFFSNREQAVNDFFSGEMSLNKAINFLKSANISYVFFGPQEKDKNVKKLDNYSFLKPVFESNYVTIFAVVK